MKLEDTKAIVQRCTNGMAASCMHACPFHLDIRTFTERCAREKWLPAYKTLRNGVVFPEIVSRICDAPCQNHCQRTKLGDEPIDLPALERAAVRHTKKRQAESFVVPPRTETVAVIGAGLGGLSLALALAQKKYAVTVYDKNDGWGGRLREHPDWNVFDADIALQFSTVNVDFNFGRDIADITELDGFDAVYVATGMSGDDFGLLPTLDRELYGTSNPRVFLGGELIGKTQMESIAQGAELSRILEFFLQTGRTEKPQGSYDGRECENFPSIHRWDSAEIITEPPEGYSAEDAAAEGARCMQCDCSECMIECEMLDLYKKKPEKIAVEIYADSQASPPIATRVNTRQTYSCTQCGCCKAVCHEDINMAELFSMSRVDRFASGDAPLALHDYWLREMDFSVSDGAFAAPPKGQNTCEYVFFPGCQLGAYNKEHVLRTYDYLAEKYDTGIILGCCGAPAIWAGDETRQNENFDKIREIAKNFGNPKFIFACATCETMFHRFLPEIERVALYELLARDDDLSPALEFTNASIFDPCAARENEDMQNGVRELAKRSGTTLEELPDKNRCCGYGGLIQVANPKLFGTIVQNRMELSQNPYIVYCANCQEVFRSRGKECAHILDLAFGLPPITQSPKIAEKRENSKKIKGVFMERLTGDKFVPKAHSWDEMQLIIDPELADQIDRKLISTDDIKEAIHLAESTGEKFIDPDTGTVRCCLIREVLTYWVEYRKTDNDVFEILNAYYHRMSFVLDGSQ